MKFNTQGEAREFFYDTFMTGASIVAGERSHAVDEWCPLRQRHVRGYVKTYGEIGRAHV